MSRGGGSGGVGGSCCLRPVPEFGRVGGEVGDVLIGEVGGFDPPGDAGLGQQPADAPGQGVDAGGGVALACPAVPEDHIGAGIGGAPERPPVAEQVPHGRVDDLIRGPLGGQDEDHPGGAAAGDQVAGEQPEGLPVGLAADGGGVVGVLVDHDQVDMLTAVAGDLAAAGGQQVLVPVVHGG